VLVQQQPQSLFSGWNDVVGWGFGVGIGRIENTAQLRVSVPPRETQCIALWAVATAGRFHAPGARTLHGMTLGVEFWCRY
jgi:hypothetical protein